jgi:hypothetical protein
VVLPGRLVEKFPVLGSVFSSLFGISGLLGWLAVAALAGNLWATFLRGSRAPIRLDPKQ